MKFIILITFIFYSPLFSGEWNHISTLPKDLDRPRIRIIDQNNLMIGGNFGITSPCVEKSTDSGKSFEVIFKDTVITHLFGNSREITSFHHETPNHILLMCVGLRYWYSEDAGKTWMYDSLISNAPDYYTEASSYKNFVLISSGDRFFKSSDYGKSWDSLKFNLNHNFDIEKGSIAAHYYKFINDTTIIANGYYSVDFYHEDNVYFHTISTDGGKSWEIASIKEGRETYFYHKLSEYSVYAVGAVQTVPYSSKYIDIFKHSTDGGYTWQKIMDTLSTPSVPLLDVDFLDDKNGIAFAREFVKLWRTTDGGLSWKRDNGPDEFDYPPRDYAFLPNGEIIAVSENGKVYKWTDPLLSVSDNKLVDKKKEISIYPNPVPKNHTINISFIPTYRGDVRLSIIDINGKTLTSFKVVLNKYEENITFKPDNDLPAGMYFIQIGYSNGIAERQKFVVE